MLHPRPAVVALVLVLANPAHAYDRYSGGPDGGCENCHATFDDALESLGGISLHTMHRDPAYGGAECNLCHLAIDYFVVWLDTSEGTQYNRGYGCSGCHTLDASLLKHGGESSACAVPECHDDGGREREESQREDYYGTPDTNLDSGCDPNAAWGDDWNGDGRGLDNDGDGLYDADDPDCYAVCGNGLVEDGETCDPPARPCPTLAECDDGDPVTTDTLRGSAETCTAECRNVPPRCRDDDWNCPMGCTPAEDSDCTTVCGDFIVDTTETCDPPAACPTDCDDDDACTLGYMTGDAATCDVACSYDVILSCADGDGCCALGCSTANDDDCSIACDNGIVEAGETCDPPETCPTSCDDGDACTVDALLGDAELCTAACDQAVIAACIDDDGCCPPACDATADNDCVPVCGNGRVEPGETCDPPASCPTTCEDDEPCTLDIMRGQPESCDVECELREVACAEAVDAEEYTDSSFRSQGCVCNARRGSALLWVLAVTFVGRRRRLTRRA